MTRARLAAAIAGIVTALLLQATVVGPAFGSLAVSLPAVIVAAVALSDGAGAGMSFGFATGLAADLASSHPAGILALCWLGVGLLTSKIGAHHLLWRNLLAAATVTALAGAAATLLLAVTGHGGPASDAIIGFIPGLLTGALLALPVVPLVARMLRTEYLRAPHPVYTELGLEPQRGR